MVPSNLLPNQNLLNILKNNTFAYERVFGFLEETVTFLFATTQLSDHLWCNQAIGRGVDPIVGRKTARFWNVYGWEEPGERPVCDTRPGDTSPYPKHISLMTTGEEERQFIYMEDCVANLVRQETLTNGCGP